MTRHGWRSYDDGPFPEPRLEPPYRDADDDEPRRCEASEWCENEPEPGRKMCRVCRGEEEEA